MEKHVEQRVEDVTYNKAKLWQIILFAMNNSSTNIYLVAFTFVTYLSTGVLGLAALFVSQLMGYIRIFDGFIDPTIGVIIDKTDTKFGKYRPILVLGNIITASSLFMMLGLSGISENLRLPLFLVVLIIHKIGYSLQQTITKAGQVALTNDPKQRPIFNIVDGIATTVLMTGSQVVVSGTLVPKHGGFTPGFFQELFLGVVIISAVLGILAIIGIWEKDNKKYFGLGEKTQETKLKDYWKVIKGNKPLQVLSISAAFVKFVAQLFGDSVIGVMLYGIIFGDYALSGKMSMLLILPGILVTVGAAQLARRKGLRFAYITALQLGIAGLVTLAAMLLSAKPGMLDLTNWNLYTIGFFVVYIIARYASSAPSGLVLTMGADITDYETSVSGRYLSGMIGTIFSLTDSIASSFAPMVVGFVLAAIGFGKEYPTVETAFSTDLRMALIVLLTVIPVVVLSLSLFLMKFYKLDREEMARIQEKIHVMKAAKDEERVRAIAKNVPLSDMDYVDVTQYKVDQYDDK
ncbi:MFS transporter [Streptococcus suis]|uniref:MFS transporter n=1 Tax=Streptococcus TaxID=1301 RepID=UPI000CF3A0EE|nr:MFS transporter [Streptococcus suis]NJW38551.1 glucuronide permease [Streptococcus suis]